jgi:hypothetical protein
MKYIFLAGAPGSKWSSVAKNIYYSDDIDRSDYRDDWTYHHDASGQMELMHLGAYFDPGMACGLPENITGLDRAQLEKHFDLPFDPTATGTKIIKSHIFSYESNIRHLRREFVDCAIVLVHRSNDACLGWWVKCGHFDITYPKYDFYYQNLRVMAQHIARQNAGIEQTIHDSATARRVHNNLDLCRALGIAEPPTQYWQNYAVSDIEVTIL